jgi:hypothetical protein
VPVRWWISVRQSEDGGLGGGEFGVHRGLLVVIDDATMNALFDREAKLFGPDEHEKPARKTGYLRNKYRFVNVWLH